MRLEHCCAGVCSWQAEHCSLCFPMVQKRSLCRGVCWCQVCLAGCFRGREVFRRSDLPASWGTVLNNKEYLQRFLWAMGDLKLENTECYRLVIYPGARQISTLLNQCNQECTRLNSDAFPVICSPSVVERICILIVCVWLYNRMMHNIHSSDVRKYCAYAFMYFLRILRYTAAVWKHKKKLSTA